MRVGFTGTRQGMTDAQKRAVENELRGLFEPGAEFHHGDCVGSDEEAAAIAAGMGYVIHSHPPTNRSMRAFTRPDVQHPALDYLARNRAIVDATDVLLAAVSGPEQQRSGTWSTVRYGRKIGARIDIIAP